MINSPATTELELLYDRMQSCTECLLHELPVNEHDSTKGFGKIQGNGIGSKFLWIGQNPSHHRIPGLVGAFEGGHGESFRQRLWSVGYSETEVFFTNVVKCSTHSLERPSSIVVQACTSLWLEKEIEIVDPMLIVALGAVSCEYFGVKGGSSKIWRRWVVYGMWHPSYVDRRPDKLEEFMNLLREAKRHGGRQLNLL